MTYGKATGWTGIATGLWGRLRFHRKARAGSGFTSAAVFSLAALWVVVAFALLSSKPALALSTFQKAGIVVEAARESAGAKPPAGYVAVPSYMAEQFLIGNTIFFPNTNEQREDDRGPIIVFMRLDRAMFSGHAKQYNEKSRAKFSDFSSPYVTFELFFNSFEFKSGAFCAKVFPRINFLTGQNPAPPQDGNCADVPIFIKKEYWTRKPPEYFMPTPPEGALIGFAAGGSLYAGNPYKFPAKVSFSPMMFEKAKSLLLSPYSGALLQQRESDAVRVNGRKALALLIGNTTVRRDTIPDPTVFDYYAKNGNIVRIAGVSNTSQSYSFIFSRWNVQRGKLCNDDEDSSGDMRCTSWSDRRLRVVNHPDPAVGDIIGISYEDIIFKGDPFRFYD